MCFNNNNRREFEHLHKDCPYRNGAQSQRQVHLNERARDDEEQEAESDEPEDQEEPNTEGDRGVFQAINKIKRAKKSARRK